ncbi:hypothetical protein AABB24_030100 [Solanum stoloniferum]|uniref:PH domain-containing protein n=1 Tax=Solanum stoloniferum TaxID=62892 RepID=A0ABD2S349_9SOLN
MQENDELKTWLLAVERGLKTLHDAVEKVFHLQKDTSTDVGKVCIAMTGIKEEGIFTVNKLTLLRVESAPLTMILQLPFKLRIPVSLAMWNDPTTLSVERSRNQKGNDLCIQHQGGKKYMIDHYRN